MSGFLHALTTQVFLQNAFFAGLLAAAACGMAGTFVVLKKVSFISGGIAHAVLGGIGLAVFLGISPFLGAVVSALFFTVVMGLVKQKMRQHEDTLIGSLWALGMSAGIIFMHLTPGYQADIMSYLFGSILMVSQHDLIMLFILDIVIFTVIFIFWRQFLAVSFDEEFASLRGIHRTLIYILLLSVIALTIVVLIRVVGLILVIALLTLPAAIAALMMRNAAAIMVVAMLVGVLCNVSGLMVCYTANLPAGPVIILLAGALYIVALAVKRFAGSR